MTDSIRILSIALALSSTAGCERHERHAPIPEPYTQEQFKWLKECVAHSGHSVSWCKDDLRILEEMKVTP